MVYLPEIVLSLYPAWLLVYKHPLHLGRGSNPDLRDMSAIGITALLGDGEVHTLIKELSGIVKRKIHQSFFRFPDDPDSYKRSTEHHSNFNAQWNIIQTEAKG